MEVTFIDAMGNDLSVVNAARVSFDKESHWEGGSHPDFDPDKKLSERDCKLIDYLVRNGHWSPFAHTAISLRIKAPIFVARQLAKHQIGFAWNEVSRRYVDSEPEFYVPDMWRKAADNVKQGSSDEPIDAAEYNPAYLYRSMLASYHNALNYGVCPEQARMLLPQSMYTEWIWTGSLYAYSRMYKERTNSDTQKETRDIAERIGREIEPLFEVSWAALRYV
jgi:thymidylate synthase (FAD)